MWPSVTHPEQAARAGVLRVPLFNVLGPGQSGTPAKAQMYSLAHPLFCIPWGTRLSGSLFTRGGCVAWSQATAFSGPHFLHLDHKALRTNGLQVTF